MRGQRGGVKCSFPAERCHRAAERHLVPALLTELPAGKKRCGLQKRESRKLGGVWLNVTRAKQKTRFRDHLFQKHDDIVELEITKLFDDLTQKAFSFAAPILPNCYVFMTKDAKVKGKNVKT